MAACYVSAQDTTVVKVSGYAEVYYGYDLSRPPTGERPDLIYNYKRHNEVNVNLALVRVELDRADVRAAVGLMAGTYAQYNLAAEPDLLRNLYEARVGVRLSRTRDLWLDAGVFPSHIGAEGVIGLDNITLTRSFAAEASPYYEAGARVTYKPGRWTMAFLVLNGWQHIQRPPGNSSLAVGTQLQYAPKEGTVFNWSTFVGSDTPDSLGLWRVFNNLYATVTSERSAMTVGVDVGLQKAPVEGDGPEGWITVYGMARGRIADRWWLVGRAEYLLDDQGVVTSGWDLAGVSAGVDLELADRASWRLEYRLLGGPNDRFIDVNGAPSNTNMAITTALCVRL
jgi:hypothetical protein